MTIRFVVQRGGMSRANFTLAYLYVRIKDGRTIDQTKKTDILVNPEWWDSRTGRLKPRASCSMDERVAITEAVLSLGAFLRDEYEISLAHPELYGTPVCLTLAEVRTLAQLDLGGNRPLDRQRDVFVFQCNTGCRVGDLVRLRKSDVADDTISFIPAKTIGERARTVTVPLNAVARGIVEKYRSAPGDGLLPFVSPQHYNTAIKRLLRIAGITRNVSVLDPLTRTEKKVPVCDIDEPMKRDLVKLLE